jgi:hypothetical protein
MQRYINKGGFMPSRINWAIQSSGVDYLHLLIVSMEYLIKSYGINARLSITVHDEIRYLVTDEDAYRAAMALQISNLWTRAMFSQQVGLNDVPQVRSSSFLETDCLRRVLPFSLLSISIMFFERRSTWIASRHPIRLQSRTGNHSTYISYSPIQKPPLGLWYIKAKQRKNGPFSPESRFLRARVSTLIS